MSTPTILAISNAVGNGTTSTYTFGSHTGPAPVLGNPVIITGCTTAGFNGNFTINGGNLTTTITVASSTNHVSEAETATGTTDIEGFNLIPTNLTTDSMGFGLFERWNVDTLFPYGNHPTILPALATIINRALN